MTDWSEYRTEILLAINEHVSAAEKSACEGKRSDALMYSNKCLALLQFGSRCKLVNDKEWRDVYFRLTIAIKTE